MIFKELKLKNAFEIRLEPQEDERGFFMRVYDDRLFCEHGLDRNWLQESESLSRNRGTLRGLHFQFPPHAETKLVRVLTGAAFFAIVDLRKNSSTFGQWDSVIISEENKNMIFVPKGLALGMCSLEDNCRLYYKIDTRYAPESAGVIKWDDPDLAIRWPIANPDFISKKDVNAGSFKDFLARSIVF